MEDNRVFSWGCNDIAPINAIHRARIKHPRLKLFQYRNNLLLVLAKDKKWAAQTLGSDPEWGGIWRAKDFKEYRDIEAY